MRETSTTGAPWYVIPSNHKWFRNLALSQIIADALDDMKLEMPKPTVDLQEIRRLYHREADEEKNGAGKKGKDKAKAKDKDGRAEQDNGGAKTE